MHDLPWLKALIKSLVLPPGGPLLLALAGLALGSRRPKLARALVAVGVVTLLALSLPVVSRILASSYSATAPFDAARASDAGAIVILGGGTRRNAPEFGGETMGRLTLERVRYGARLARQTQLPVLVAGGPVNRGKSEAVVMRDALEQEYGVKVRWLERRSLNTHENAQYAAALLRADGISSVVLVAHAFDIPRAAAEFRVAGIATIPAPTGVPGDVMDLEASDFLPSIAALEGSYYALYEMLAYLVFVANRAMG
jgi:uncharacterized SAM-binding protein YcdF (DUF218 family)